MQVQFNFNRRFIADVGRGGGGSEPCRQYKGERKRKSQKGIAQCEEELFTAEFHPAFSALHKSRR